MNMNIWNQVCETDTSATKMAKVNGQNISSINGYYVIKRATEVFGPIGIGWGYEILEERFDEGKPFKLKQEDGSYLDVVSKTHTIKLNLWFKHDGKQGSIIQYGHTESLYQSKFGASYDGEAPKKSLMDAIKKSLSMLGFCGDVFMGMFDDEEYLNQIQVSQEIEKAESKDEKIAQIRGELTDYVKSYIEAIQKASSVSEVSGIKKVVVRHLSLQSKIDSLRQISESGILRITQEAEKKIGEISNG